MQHFSELLAKKRIYVGVFFSPILIAIVGIMALLYSPYLGIDFGSHDDKWYIASVDKDGPAKKYLPLTNAEVVSIAGLTLQKNDLSKEWDDIGVYQDFYRFLYVQKYFATHIQKDTPISITVRDKNKVTKTIMVTASDYPFRHILAHTGLMLLIALITLAIGLIVIFKKSDDIRAMVFFVMTIWGSSIEITLGLFIARDLSMDFNVFMFLNILNNISIFIGAALLLHFALIFPESKTFAKNDTIIIFLYVAASLCAISYGTRFFYYSYQAFLLFCMVGGTIAMMHSYLTIKSPALKAQAKIVLFGTSIAMAIFPLFYFGPMILTGHRFISGYVPVAFTLLVPLSMAFAITRYKLMDIDTIFDNTLLYISTLGILAILDITLISSLANTKLLNLNISAPVATTIAVWLVVLAYVPVRDMIQKWIRSLSNREVYDINKISFELNKELLSADTIESAFEKTMNAIRYALKSKGGYALLLNEQGSVIMWNDAYPIDLPIDIESIRHSHAPIPLFNIGDNATLPPDYAGGVLVPIVGNTSHLGYIVLQNKASGRLYDNEDIKLLSTIATQVAMCMEAIYSREGLIKKEQEAVTEKERISREIHDGIGNNLAQALILSSAADTNKKYLADLQKLISESLSNLRELIWSVETGSTTIKDLVVYISDKIQSMDGYNVKLSISSDIEDEHIEISSVLKLNILRIMQEAITNILKHANATEITIMIEQHEDKLRLEISDNGRGFDAEDMIRRGYGIRNMRERCKEIHAKFRINSQPGHGTSVLVELPL